MEVNGLDKVAKVSKVEGTDSRACAQSHVE